MSDVKHTPGPWRAEVLQGWGNDPVVTAEGWPKPIATTVAHPDRYYRHVSYKEGGRTYTALSKETAEGEDRKTEALSVQQANARLIAAAPDLLAALQELEARGHTPMVWDHALKAIAKATGDAQ